MSGRENSPITQRASNSLGIHYQLGDDIELPHQATTENELARNETDTFGHGRTWTSGIGKWVGIASLAGAIAIGGLMFGGGFAERNHENWKHVAAATDASADGTNSLTHVTSAGAASEVQQIEFTRADHDFVTTSAVRQSLRFHNSTAAIKALQDAQQFVSLSDPNLMKPTIKIGSQLESAIKGYQEEFFKVHLFDCCSEDGDVVEILINGNSFATVPITHKGALLSIPLRRGGNTLTLRGVKDGGGGITVSFATSQGNYYCRAMRVGEEYTMGVVTR